MDVESNKVCETRWLDWHELRDIGYDIYVHEVVTKLMHGHRFKSLPINKDAMSKLSMDDYHYETSRNLSYWMWVYYG